MAPGSEQRFAGGGTAVWRVQSTYGDILDGFSAAGMKNGDIGLAMAVIERPAAGEAALLLGGNVRGVWVNGAWVGGGENSPAFDIDGTEVRVRMNAGQNRILLRVERLDRPVLLTMRAVSPGFVGQVAGGISPYIASEHGQRAARFSWRQSNAKCAESPLRSHRAGRARGGRGDHQPQPSA